MKSYLLSSVSQYSKYTFQQKNSQLLWFLVRSVCFDKNKTHSTLTGSINMKTLNVELFKPSKKEELVKLPVWWIGHFV